MGIVHASVSPVVLIGDVKPNLALVAVVLVASMGGFLPGITWAFVGGLTVNLLVGEPLGSVPLALLVVAALVAGGQRMIGRPVWIYPIVAAFAGSLVADVIGLGLSQLVADAVVGPLPTDLIGTAALVNAAVAAVVVLPARMLASRYVRDEATAW